MLRIFGNDLVDQRVTIDIGNLKSRAWQTVFARRREIDAARIQRTHAAAMTGDGFNDMAVFTKG